MEPYTDPVVIYRNGEYEIWGRYTLDPCQNPVTGCHHIHIATCPDGHNASGLVAAINKANKENLWPSKD